MRLVTLTTQEQITRVVEILMSGYEEDKEDFMCIITKSYTVSLKAHDEVSGREHNSRMNSILTLEELHESCADIQILPIQTERKLEQKKLNLFRENCSLLFADSWFSFQILTM